MIDKLLRRFTTWDYLGGGILKASPKVLFISHSPYFGGAERCLYYLLKGLHRDKYNLSAMLPPKPLIHRLHQQNLRKLIEDLDMPVHISNIRWWVGRWPRYRAFADGLVERVANIVQVMKKEQFDLVVSNTSAFVEGALASRYCGISHVWYVHEMLIDDPVLRSFMPLEHLYRTMDSLSHRIITVSEAVKKQIAPYATNDKLRVVHTGLPEIKPKSMNQPKKIMFDLPSHTPVVAFVGLLSERKGVIDFVDSSRHVLQKFPNTIFVMAGPDGGKGREVISKINQCGMRDSFRILGNRSDIPDILAASDMLVLPSLADPLPLAVLEAMAVGIPVVATRSGGCEEMVLDGVTGSLVPVKNPALLSQAIIELIEIPSKRVSMGLNGSRRFSEQFSYDHYIAGFERVLDEACNSTSHSAGNDTDLTSIDDLVDQLHKSAEKQASLMSTQATGIRKITSNIEASVRCWSLL
jgi:glycosyltransferase involved in cell wall biosynthesis